MNNNESETSFIDDVFGGEATSDDHSQEQKPTADVKAEINETQESDTPEDFMTPDDESDSVDEPISLYAATKKSNAITCSI